MEKENLKNKQEDFKKNQVEFLVVRITDGVECDSR